MSDIDFLRAAAIHAATGSHDPHTQNGAIVVSPKAGLLACAANALPAGITPTPHRLERPGKYDVMEHAERAAIYKAAALGLPTAGGRMYCLWFACPDCARAIICAGIKEVVGTALCRTATPDRWLGAVLAGERLLEEAGVGMRWVAEPLGVEIQFDGRGLKL